MLFQSYVVCKYYFLDSILFRKRSKLTAAGLPRYANRNELTSIPADIGRLCQLEQLQLSKNRISTVPAELMTGCHKLEKLVLSNNNLTSVPESIHSCPNLDLQTDGNPNFNLPPKPQPSEPKGAEAYFADFARIAPSLDGPKRSMREVLGLPTTPVRVHSPLKVCTTTNITRARPMFVN